MTLPDLIAALEAADVGSRELDDKIATAIWGEPRPMGSAGEPKTLYWEMSPGFYRSRSPCFTESLDDALTLVPEYADMWDAGWVKENGFFVGHVSVPHERDGKKGSIFWSGKAQSPALALCISALRARLAEG